MISFKKDYTVIPYLFSCTLGALTTLAFAPMQQHYLILLTLPLFFLLSEKSCHSFKQWFSTGWFFGFGFFCTSLAWIGNAFDSIGHPSLMPLAWFGLPALLALFYGGASFLSHFGKTRFEKLLLFVIGFGGAEWLRGHAFTGFPWNLFGYVWDLPLLQVTSVIGIYGLTLVTLIWCALIASKNKILIISCLISIACVWTWGHMRLSISSIPSAPLTVRLVQPSIPQKEKWKNTFYLNNLEKHMAISQLEGEKSIDILIWPEASVPFFLEDDIDARDLLAKIIPDKGVLLVSGPRLDKTQNNDQLRLSLFVLDNEGNIQGVYDKSHLVPFGEYFPFRNLIDLPKVTVGTIDFAPGKGSQTINVNNTSFSPLICYEAIFPGKVIDPINRPRWMLNVTNDAWYGNSFGPFQHFSIIRVRAIEEGLPLIRVANNGISAVIDPFGKIVVHLEQDEVGFIDEHIPSALPPTLYSLWRDSFFLITQFLLIFILGLLKFYNYRVKKSDSFKKMWILIK